MRESRPILSQQESEGRDEDPHLRMLEIVKYIGRECLTYEDLGRCQDLHVRRTTIVGPRRALYTIHYQTQVYLFSEYWEADHGRSKYSRWPEG